MVQRHFRKINSSKFGPMSAGLVQLLDSFKLKTNYIFFFQLAPHTGLLINFIVSINDFLMRCICEESNSSVEYVECKDKEYHKHLLPFFNINRFLSISEKSCSDKESMYYCPHSHCNNWNMVSSHGKCEETKLYKISVLICF